MVKKWHNWLAMPKNDLKWHTDDIGDEIREYREERNLFKKWSELSDIAYTSTRAGWSGHKLDFPFSKTKYFIGLLYMYPKYTSRYLFFRRAARRVDYQAKIHEVRNPKKIEKLKEIAQRNELDREKFVEVCRKQLRYWLLLP